MYLFIHPFIHSFNIYFSDTDHLPGSIWARARFMQMTDAILVPRHFLKRKPLLHAKKILFFFFF